MPELPEVETIACGLRPQLTGRRIVSVAVRNEGTVQGDAAAFARCVPGRVIAGVGRRGKLLLLELVPLDGAAGRADAAGPAGAAVDAPSDVPPDAADLMTCRDAAGKMAGSSATGAAGASGNTGNTGNTVSTGSTGGNRVPHLLGVHLKMTGRLFVYGPEVAPNTHTRVIFGLDDGNRLFFDDARKFGYVRALSEADLATWDFWRSLGPEPLEIAAPDFAALFRVRSSRPAWAIKHASGSEVAVVMKLSQCEEEVKHFISLDEGLVCHYFENVGADGEFYTCDKKDILAREFPYFSLMIIKGR